MPLSIQRMPDALRLNRRAEENAVPKTLKTVRARKYHLGPSGEGVGIGGTYDIRESYAMELAGKGLVEIVGDALNPAAATIAGPDGEAAADPLKEWTMGTTPEAYLERYGADAKHSEWARQTIALKNAQGSTPPPSAE